MKTSVCRIVMIATLCTTSSFHSATLGAEWSDGSWALTLPDGRAGWLGVEEADGQLSARLMWGAGSVVPVESASVEGDQLILTRVLKRRSRRPGAGATETVETITAERSGDALRLTLESKPASGKPTRQEFTGKWCPPVPPKPDPSKATLGEPIVLFDGTSLNGWMLTNPKQTNGWSIQEGDLVNDPVQADDGPHVPYGNLRTVDEFEDFKLKLELNAGPGNNSGIYLRGIYELQVSESHGRDLHPNGSLGALYSRIAPSVKAEKPAGQWQTLEITLLDRHITVVLNGTTILDNIPAHGCTGGALWSDPFRPGPIYLQGDHTAIRYRNIVLTPIVKR